MGFYQVTFSLAFALGPWLGNVIYEYYGAQILWLAAFIIGLISAVMLHRVEKPVLKDLSINS